MMRDKLDNNGIILCKYQARIFEDSLSKLSCSSKIFLRRFIHSRFTYSILDKNNSNEISGDTNDCFRALEEQYGPSDYGNFKYDKAAFYWLGYISRALAYLLDINTNFLNYTFPLTELIKRYEVLHTLSPEVVLATLLEEKGLKHDDFDPYLRFKRIYQDLNFK